MNALMKLIPTYACWMLCSVLWMGLGIMYMFKGTTTEYVLCFILSNTFYIMYLVEKHVSK